MSRREIKDKNYRELVSVLATLSEGPTQVGVIAIKNRRIVASAFEQLGESAVYGLVTRAKPEELEGSLIYISREPLPIEEQLLLSKGVEEIISL